MNFCICGNLDTDHSAVGQQACTVPDCPCKVYVFDHSEEEVPAHG